MRYFLLRFALAGLFSLGLLILLLYLARRVRKARVRYKLSYFLPTILALYTVFFIAQRSGPLALDCINIYRKQYQVKQVEVEDLRLFHRCLMSDGQSYFFNGFNIKPEEGHTYQITYTKWSLYIIDIREI